MKNFSTKSASTKQVFRKISQILALLFFITFCTSGCSLKDLFNGGKYDPIELKKEISFHFLELGNGHSGDCIYIKAGNNDILIDAGSLANSLPTLKSYINNHCKDGVLEYVIATHAHEDHIACFSAEEGIFDTYECKTIIDFPRTNSTSKVYNKYLQKRDAEVEDGAVHYTALECYREINGAKKNIELTENVSMTILYNYYYENKATKENNYSVCLLFTHGNRNFIFTGDLEEKGEEYLVSYNSLPQVELYKAGHHGSKTSSSKEFLSVIQPKIVCCTCCAGSVEYLTTLPQNLSNTFPTQTVIDEISLYTDKVYVTSMINVKFDEVKDKYVDDGEYQLLNGNIVVYSKKEGVLVECSNNNTLLKDTSWFKANRTMPSNWVA